MKVMGNSKKLLKNVNVLKFRFASALKAEGGDILSYFIIFVWFVDSHRVATGGLLKAFLRAVGKGIIHWWDYFILINEP